MTSDTSAMPDTSTATPWTRSAYDHRLRAQVVRAGTTCLPEHIRIPRSTVSTWRRRGQRPVVTIEPLDQDRQQLFDTIVKLDRRVRILAAVVRILLAMLRCPSPTSHPGADGMSILGGRHDHGRDRSRVHPCRARDRVGTDEVSSFGQRNGDPYGLRQADTCEDQAARRS